MPLFTAITPTPGRHGSGALLTRACAGMGLAIFLLAHPGVRADGHFIVGDDCHFDYGDLGNCTANEINIASASNATTEAEFCIAGDPVEVTRIDVTYGLNTGVRYDPLLWVGLDGNDPRVADADPACYVSAVPPPTEPPTDPPDADYSLFANWEGDDGDSCLDVSKPDPGTTEVFYRVPFTVVCTDSVEDEDSLADFQTVITWHQNTAFTCGTDTENGEDFGPGAPPKCDWSLISLEIPVYPQGATLTLLKEVDNEGGGANVDTDWTLTATGPETVSGVEGDADITAMKVPAGVYQLSESGPGGYAMGDWDCVGGSLSGAQLTLAADDVAVCTITNTFITDESLSVAKVIVSDNGGGATLDDFDVSVDDTEVDWPDPASTTGGSATVATAAGTYTLSELDLAGYAEGAWSCIDQDENAVPVTNGGAFDGADVEVAAGRHVSCTITNDDIPPQLTVIKHVVNDSGGTAVAAQWTMVVTATNPSQNNFPGEEAPGTTITIDAGAYSVDESGGPGGYLKVLGAGCAGTLDVGETATCTITNDDIPPQLTVIKHVVNDNGGSAVAAQWTMNVTATDPSANAFPGAEAPGTTITIDAGPYSVDESGGPGGYEKTLGAGCAGALGLDESATCTITNDDITPELTIIVDVTNDDGGTAVASDWTVDVTAANPSDTGFPGAAAPGTTITLDAGVYSVALSDGEAGYTVSPGPGCAGTLDPGETASCTVTVDDLPAGPQLTVIKHVVNDNGGTAVAGQWTMDVTATNPSSNNFPGVEAPGVTISIDPGAYSVDESGGPGGYQKTLSADCSGNLADGESATCTITNDDIAPGLTVVVTVINDNEGTAVAGDWTVDITAINPSATGFPGAEAPGTSITIDAGPYSVGLSGGPGGYSLAPDAGCAGALGPGAAATCTVTVDDIPPGAPPRLTVIKHVVNDDGGTAVAADWTMVVTATNPSMGSFPGAEAPGTTITLDAGAYSVDETGGPNGYQKTVGPGCAGTLGLGESATCTIVNDDEDDGAPAPDIRVTKTVTPALTDCPVLIGEILDFVITVTNAGDAPAEGVILDEQWSWQLKPSKSPDMYECSEPKPHARRCKLGDMEPGASQDIAIAFMVGGNSAAELCNTATATSNPAETDTIEDNVSQVCFESVRQLGAQCDDLAPALVGVYYEQELSLTGGTAPTATEVLGLPEDLAGQPGNPVQVEGCPIEPGQFTVTVNASDPMSCQEDVPVECPLTVVSDPSCALAELSPIAVAQLGVTTPAPATLPDESVQKLAVEATPVAAPGSGAPHRYLVGFAFADHGYASDPNGAYLNPGRNYDMRLTKYDDAGALVWDKTYDTGNDDYGYAVALSADEQTVYVGGGALRETGPHAWMDAVLLEIDAATGCLVGDHFQGAAQGTTSVYYDIAAGEDFVHAVGERQVNPGIPAGQTDQGALVSEFSMMGPGATRDALSCSERILVPGANAGELAWEWNAIRLAVAGLEPVTAYSVQAPDADCAGCEILVGGGAGPDGWLARLDGDNRLLEPFLDIADLRIQDVALHGRQIVVVGSSAEHDMRIAGYERDGSTAWPELRPGKGRLRGVTADAAGFFYAVGRSDGAGSSGLVFKVSPDGQEVDRDQLGSGVNTSFNDVGVFDPGFGSIAAQVEESGYDYGWMQVEFTCDPDCE